MVMVRVRVRVMVWERRESPIELIAYYFVCTYFYTDMVITM